jgi:ABC-type lipoprotein release transport system permease subunit
MLNVRTRMAPETIIQPVRQALASAAPGLALLETGTLAQAADEITAPERMTATLASLFGAMATLLAGIGAYGLLAYAVTQRRREIGIRMVLGAQPAQVAKLIATTTLTMTVMGIAVGLGAAFLSGPAIQSLLYGISPQDPTALAGAGIFMVLIAVAATIVPIADAVHTQAAETLRTEA